MGFIPFGFGFSVVTFWATPFGSRAKVYLSGKAETAIETRQVFHHTPRAVVKDPSTVLRICGVGHALRDLDKIHEFETRLPPGWLAASLRGFAFCVADPIGSVHERS